MKIHFLGKNFKTKTISPNHYSLILLGLFLLVSAAVAEEAKPGCRLSCGDLTIPFPFGIGNGCFLDGFNILCNDSFNPPKAFLGNGQFEVVNISVPHNQVSLKNEVAHTNWGFNGTVSNSTSSIDLTDTPFAFSNTANKFTVTGCNSLGAIQLGEGEVLTGCLSLCSSSNSKSEERNNDEPCSGIGCCQTSISNGLKSFVAVVANIFNESYIREVLNVSDFSTRYQCGYAFLVDATSYKFEESDLDLCSSSKIENSSVVLDWVVGNQTCEEAVKNSATYACKENSICEDYDPLVGDFGYQCSCKQGYRGNPYLNGCQDIDECQSPNNPCEGNGTCFNLDGAYDCICPPGTHRDGPNCRKSSSFPVLEFVLGFSGLLLLLLLLPSIYFFLKRRKLMKLREKFFRENGGLLLEQQNPLRQSNVDTTKVFTAKELEKATENYSEDLIIGQGGYGTVYKGVLQDKRVVAVKKSKIVDKTQIEQFINEVVVLTQINHRNVVKLLGCCLETEVPLLVYEFVSHGSLHTHIHGSNEVGSMSWDIRLRIAMETASALSYLHSAASIPIIHRDVKSANILLDENYTAKVSDFGASRLIPIDQTQISTLVQGTLGYLDPEYFQTSQLTEKSDVYSYGVVLVELLTGKMPISFARPEAQRNLSSFFITSMQQNLLFEILEPEIGNQLNVEEVKVVAELAMRCLRLRGDERPTMKEVFMELTGLRKVEKHPWDESTRSEGLSLLDQDYLEMHTSNTSTGTHALSLELPRGR